MWVNKCVRREKETNKRGNYKAEGHVLGAAFDEVFLVGHDGVARAAEDVPLVAERADGLGGVGALHHRLGVAWDDGEVYRCAEVSGS